jgi:NADPH:quinone reductase-like Zn-dependent oxidoreductase
VHGAAGGVGSAAVQIARDLGARVIGTASPANHSYLASLGAEPVSYGPDLVCAVRAIGAVSAVFDTHGGEQSIAAIQALAPDLARAVTTVPDERATAAGLALATRNEHALAALIALVERGALRFPIAQRVPLAHAAQALAISSAGHVRGKLILVP